jgi:hypothetical protein
MECIRSTINHTLTSTQFLETKKHASSMAESFARYGTKPNLFLDVVFDLLKDWLAVAQEDTSVTAKNSFPFNDS